MLLKYLKTILTKNIVQSQIYSFSGERTVLNRLLSTSSIKQNQYDNLYADRWAKFQCK